MTTPLIRTGAPADASGSGTRPATRPVRVLIVADVRLFRDGLTELIGRHEGIEVVAGARSDEAPRLDLAALTPDVVLWDVAAQGVRPVREFMESVPSARVVVLSIPELEPEIMRFAEAGMAGYVTRDADAGELVAATVSAARRARCSPASPPCSCAAWRPWPITPTNRHSSGSRRANSRSWAWSGAA